MIVVIANHHQDAERVCLDEGIDPRAQSTRIITPQSSYRLRGLRIVDGDRVLWRLNFDRLSPNEVDLVPALSDALRFADRRSLAPTT